MGDLAQFMFKAVMTHLIIGEVLLSALAKLIGGFELGGQVINLLFKLHLLRCQVCYC